MNDERRDINYREATFVYASGTGNSRRVAAWLADRAEAAGVTATVRGIEDRASNRAVPSGSDALLGIVFPTHAFTAPWTVIRFALGLPRRPSTAVVVVPTRGGMRVGSFYAPGLEGTAGYIVAAILALKGYTVRGIQAIDMPANWTVLHPAQSDDAVVEIEARARARVGGFADQILGGNVWYGGLLSLLFGIALLPVSLGYNLMGRFFLAKLFFASDLCTSCGACARGCPKRAIRMWSVFGRRERPYWTYSCESCMRCMNACPVGAVEAGYSFGVVLYFLLSVPFAAIALDQAARTFALPAIGENPFIGAVANWAGKLLAIYIAYLGFSLLLRVPIANRLFTLTTPTHFYRRISRARL